MGEHPGDGDRPPATDDETARLELPTLRLPRFGRRRKAQDDGDGAAAPAEGATADAQLAAPPREPVASPEPESRAGAEPEPDSPAPAEPEPEPQPEPERQLEAELVPEPAPDAEAEPDPEPEPVAREPFTLPRLPGRVAAVVTGLVVGVVGVALAYLSLQGCNAVRGTRTCGGGPGLLLLLVILVLMVLVGGVLLALWDVSEPRSTSFLGVGVLAVVVLITSLRDLDSVWTFLVVPVICAVSFLLAHWVTTAFVELPEKGPQHDIR